jgi:hypothetical protein
MMTVITLQGTNTVIIMPDITLQGTNTVIIMPDITLQGTNTDITLQGTNTVIIMPVAVSFIGGGNRSTWRMPPIYRKSLTKFIT